MTATQLWRNKRTHLLVQGLFWLWLCLPLSSFGQPQLGEAETSDFTSKLAAGVAYEAKGDLPAAEKSYRAALMINERSVEVTIHLASVLEKERQMAAAIHYWNQALSLRPDDVELQSSIGAAYLESGQNEAALKMLQVATQHQPTNGAALINLGTVLTRLDRYGEAEEAYRKAITVPAFADTAQLSLVKVQLTLNRYNEALPLVLSYTKMHPDDSEARVLLGITYQRLNRNEDAERVLREAVAQTHSDFDSEYHLGALLRAEKKNTEAISYLTKAVLLRPDAREAHFQLSRAYRAMNDESMASQEEAKLREIETARATDTQVVVLENEARQMQERHDFAKAIALYQQILEMLPRDAKVRYDLALIYEQMRDRKSERRALEEALERDSSLAAARGQLGFLDVAEGQKAKGEIELRAALREDPQNVEALGNLGVLDAQAGRLDEAEHLLNLAVESNPSYEKGFLNLGLVLATKGNYAAAVEALTSAVQLDPTDASAVQVLEQIRSSSPATIRFLR